MPTLQRTMGEVALRFQLNEETPGLHRAIGLARSGRTARTLVRDGVSRVTLVALGAAGEIPMHRTEGPITILPLGGQITDRAADEAHVLKTGDLLALGAGIPHSVESARGWVFILTAVRTL